MLSRNIEIQNRKFAEKKEAYVGLLEAYLGVAQDNNHDALMNFAYWQLRCEIVGSLEVRKAIEALKSSEAESRGRSAAQEKIKSAIRRDLGVAQIAK